MLVSVQTNEAKIHGGVAGYFIVTRGETFLATSLVEVKHFNEKTSDPQDATFIESGCEHNNDKVD